MSGREQEPIAAFFPSIDRNLMRDLDRQLRSAAPPAEAPPPDLQSERPSTADILEAVEQAAASMAAMQARIEELEATQYQLEATNHQLRAKLGELLQSQQAAEATSRADRDHAARAEQIATQYQSRAQLLENDLETALGDIKKIAEAISGALGT